jgi:hypothetical protein
MSRKYYSLLVRESATDAWELHFGDYNRATVEQEQSDWLDSDGFRLTPPARKSTHTKIITSGDTQASIMAAIETANGYR